MAGFDYSQLMQTLANTKLQKSNPALYQTIQNLIVGTQNATATLNEQFTLVNGQQTSFASGVAATFDALNASISTLATTLNNLIISFNNALNFGVVQVVEAGGLTSITPNGAIQVIKDSAGTAAGSNITINATVDGVANPKITTNYGVFRVYRSPNNGNFYSW